MSNSEHTTFDHLHRSIDRLRDTLGIPGLAMACTDRERELHASTCGLACLASDAPVTSETLFPVGSITKVFTSLMLLQLYDERWVDLDAPITSYLPWFDVSSVFEPIPVRALMGHTGGIIAGNDLSPDSLYEVWALRHTTATRTPNASFHYSNVGYKTLGFLVEAVTGQSYHDCLRTFIFEPLGMVNTYPAMVNALRPRCAVGYRPLYDDRPMPADRPIAPAVWIEAVTGDGCIVSTAQDMIVFLRLLLNRGQGPEGPLISEESADLLLGGDRPWRTDDFYCKYGLAIRLYGDQPIIHHSGSMPGYMATMLGDLNRGLGVVALTNGPEKWFDFDEMHTLVEYTLDGLRAIDARQPVPEPPEQTDPYVVPDAVIYAGTYVNHGECGEDTEGTEMNKVSALTFIARQNRLLLEYESRQIALEQRGEDRFYADHPKFRLFYLIFERQDGVVVAVSCGPSWYTNGTHTYPTAFVTPEAWQTYTGHYRAHHPWASNFRVIPRRDLLIMVYPSGEEQVLHTVNENTFRPDDEEDTPEWLRFDTVVNGRALRANLSGCDYYRWVTPLV